MKRNTIFGLVVGFVVVIGLPIAYWLVSPLFITREVNESLADIPMPIAPSPAVGQQPATIEVLEPSDEMPPVPAPAEAPAPSLPVAVRQGTFIGQALHNGEGTVKLLEVGDKHYVRFEDDFSVTNGPDLFVYFGKDGSYVDEARIAALKGNVGGQNYEVPATIDVDAYNEVWVWCRSFSVPFARAVLKK